MALSLQNLVGTALAVDLLHGRFTIVHATMELLRVVARPTVGLLCIIHQRLQQSVAVGGCRHHCVSCRRAYSIAIRMRRSLSYLSSLIKFCRACICH